METQNVRAGLCGKQVPPFQGSRHFHPKTQASAPLWLGLSTFAPLALRATGGICLPSDAGSLKAKRQRTQGPPFQCSRHSPSKPRPSLRFGLGFPPPRLWRSRCEAHGMIRVHRRSVASREHRRSARRQRRGSRKPRPTEAQQAEARPGFPKGEAQALKGRNAARMSGAMRDCRRRRFSAPSAHAAIPRQRPAPHGLEHETSGTLDRR